MRTRRFARVPLLVGIVAAVGLAFGQPVGATARQDAPATSYSQIEAAVLKADSLIKDDPRPFFKKVQSLIVTEGDRVMFERYYNGSDAKTPVPVQSQTKSVVAILLGIAIDKGYVKGEDEPLSTYFPEHFNDKDALKATVTVRDLLTMSAAHGRVPGLSRRRGSRRRLPRISRRRSTTAATAISGG